MTVRDQQIVTSAFDQASEAMMITDAAERVVRINRQFTQLTGFDPSEIIGQTPAILRSGKNDPGFFNEFWNSLNNDGQWRGEIWNRKKNGRLFMADLTVSAIVNHYQKVTYYLAIYRDITQVREDERKREMQEKREPQTFLLTRTAFFHHLADLCAQPPPPDSCPALLLLNLDRFREVNDLNGVAIADEILHETAHRLRKCLRDSDVIGRLNGDEFGVLLPELKAADDMNKVGEKFWPGSRLLSKSAKWGQPPPSPVPSGLLRSPPARARRSWRCVGQIRRCGAPVRAAEATIGSRRKPLSPRLRPKVRFKSNLFTILSSFDSISLVRKSASVLLN